MFAVRFTLITMLLLGAGYHAFVLAVSQMAWPEQAEGSLVRGARGQVVGSRLIAQRFARPEYFQPRPSGVDYDAAAAGGTNQGPSNPAHLTAVRERLAARVTADHVLAGEVPAEMITASGSGLDPEISPPAADLQIRRVAASRAVDPDRLRALVQSHVEPPALGFLGRARINVLELNLSLDRTFGPPPVIATTRSR